MTQSAPTYPSPSPRPAAVAILFLATCVPATNATAAVVNLLVGTAGGAVQSYNAQTGSNEGTFVSGLGNVIGVTRCTPTFVASGGAFLG